MKTSDFYYDLSPGLIAQTPLADRTGSRMLAVDRETGGVTHSVFRDVGAFLRPGDCLVLNDSRVMPARLPGKNAATGGEVEVLLLHRRSETVWEVLTGPGKRAKPGAVITFGDGDALTCRVLDILDGGNRLVEFAFAGNFFELLDTVGEMPLPRYIKERLAEKERYQTVYAKELGSAAAPTAGLHFTPEILEGLRAQGVSTAFLTLHVGVGTFRPVKTENISEHHMHSEFFALSEESASLLRRTKQNGGRIISVGTTCCRTLEFIAKEHGEVVPCSGWTDIFIYPGFDFRVLDGLLTNFHLPESTLIMLVSAFAGYTTTMNAYREAVRQRYRFFSFGDCMLVL